MPGENNINADPQVVDADQNDFHLTYSSPCIDAGDPDNEEDEDESVADIGAYFYFHRTDYRPDSPFVGINTPISFTDLSEGFDDQETTYSWDFGDGNTSNEQNPIHTYASSGVYDVSFTIEITPLIGTKIREKFIVVQEETLQAPQDVTISLTGDDINITWSPVLENTDGNVVAISSYLIYSCDTPDGIYEYVYHNIGETYWNHQDGAVDVDMQFYIVIGFVGQVRDIDDYINTHRFIDRYGNVVEPREGRKDRTNVRK